MEKATFAAGCFWGVEEVFRKVEGVVETKVGYVAGEDEEPEEPAAAKEGAETVEIVFDPRKIDYRRLLYIFWHAHDPTQEPATGESGEGEYRSVIFYHTPEQEVAARASVAAVRDSGNYAREVITEVKPAARFMPAAERHQKYVAKKKGEA